MPASRTELRALICLRACKARQQDTEPKSRKCVYSAFCRRGILFMLI